MAAGPQSRERNESSDNGRDEAICSGDIQHLSGVRKGRPNTVVRPTGPGPQRADHRLSVMGKVGDGTSPPWPASAQATAPLGRQHQSRSPAPHRTGAVGDPPAGLSRPRQENLHDSQKMGGFRPAVRNRGWQTGGRALSDHFTPPIESASSGVWARIGVNPGHTRPTVECYSRLGRVAWG